MSLKLLSSTVVAALLLSTSSYAEEESIPNPFEDVVGAEIAVDSATNAAESISYKLKFKKGWTMFGLPGYKAYKVQDILGDKSTIETLYYYDNKKNDWATFTTDTATGGFSMLLPGIGYWVKSRAPFVVEFKTNLPSSISNYEKVAILKPLDATKALDAANLQAPMPVETASYEDTWGDGGKIEDNFNKGYGSIDWTERKPENFSKDDWNAAFRFDPHMLIDKSYTDSDGTKIRFRPNPTDFKVMDITIISGSTSLGGQAIISDTGALNLNYLGSTGETVKVSYKLVDITEESGGKINLKIKNETTKNASTWAVSEIFNIRTGSWGNSTDFFNKDFSKEDIDLKNQTIDWNNIDAANKDSSFAQIQNVTPKCQDGSGNLIDVPKIADGSRYAFPQDPEFPAACSAIKKQFEDGLKNEAISTSPFSPTGPASSSSSATSTSSDSPFS